MAKRISGSEYPLSKIFSSDFEYKIPYYQRPYAWQEDQVSELFDDLFEFYTNNGKNGNAESYFLGSIVLIKEESIPHSEVIDGQQRLTSITILLALMASKMSDVQKNELLKYIREPGNKFEGLDPKPRLVLRERDQDFFEKYVQQLDFGGLISLDARSLENESQKNIKKNAICLEERLDKHFEGDEEKLTSFGQFLVQRCFLVAVSTPSQQSAFRVFSVMNSRGMDLQATDIIKADIIGTIDQKDLEEYSKRWEDMEVELGRSVFNDLFSYVRMIYAKEKARGSVLEEFRKHVIEKSGKSSAYFVSDILEPYSEALSTIRNANYQATSNAQEVNGYLKWLNRIDFSDWIPPAILFLSQNKNNSEYVLWFFQRLECLSAYMHICASNVNERIERYAQLIKDIEKPKTLQNPVQAAELLDNEKKAFCQALDGDIYLLTPRRRNYLILRLDSFISDGAASYDASVLTIEHVLPQTVPPKSDWEAAWPDVVLRDIWVHRIANLVPLNRRRNSQAQNYDFARKKQAYFSGRNNVSSYALTSQVLSEKEWTPEVIQKRQGNLLGVLTDNWKLTTGKD